MEPVLPADERPMGRRLAEMVDLTAADCPLAPLIKGLTRDDPAQRWSLEEAARFLAGPPRPAPRPARPASAEAGRLIGDGLGYPRDTITLDQPYLWRPPRQRVAPDPGNMAAGAGGVLAVLTRAATLDAGPDVRPLVAAVAGWMRRRLPRPGRDGRR